MSSIINSWKLVLYIIAWKSVLIFNSYYISHNIYSNLFYASLAPNFIPQPLIHSKNTITFKFTLKIKAIKSKLPLLSLSISPHFSPSFFLFFNSSIGWLRSPTMEALVHHYLHFFFYLPTFPLPLFSYPENVSRSSCINIYFKHQYYHQWNSFGASRSCRNQVFLQEAAFPKYHSFSSKSYPFFKVQFKALLDKLQNQYFHFTFFTVLPHFSLYGLKKSFVKKFCEQR